MPSRKLREEILTSEAVNSLKPHAELFYRRLMSVVDDYGRFDARPSVLRVRCYPLQLEKVSESDVESWLAMVESAGLVRLYSYSGKPYIELQKLGAPQFRPSKFPPPPWGGPACAPPRERSNSAEIDSSYSVSESNTGTVPGANSAGPVLDGVNEAKTPGELTRLWLHYCRAPGRKLREEDLTAAFTALVESGWLVEQLRQEIIRADRDKAESWGMFHTRLTRTRERAAAKGPGLAGPVVLLTPAERAERVKRARAAAAEAKRKAATPAQAAEVMARQKRPPAEG